MTVTLTYGTRFSVRQIAYARFSFGTDNGYRARNRCPLTPEPGKPWANRESAVISNPPTRPEPVDHMFSIGDVVHVLDGGIDGYYSIEHDHNDNVQFVPANAPTTMEPYVRGSVALLCDAISRADNPTELRRLTKSLSDYVALV